MFSPWLFVENLSHLTTESVLINYFTTYAGVVSCTLLRNASGRLNGCASLCLQSKRGVERVQSARPHVIYNEICTRSMCPPNSKNSRQLDRDSASCQLHVSEMLTDITVLDVYSCLDFLGDIEYVEMDSPYQSAGGQWTSSAVVHFSDYDSVDQALMLPDFTIMGCLVTLRSDYTLALDMKALKPSHNIISNDNNNNNNNNKKGGARKKNRGQTQLLPTVPMEEIDPIRGQLKRKSTKSAGSGRVSQQKLSTSDDIACVFARDTRVHRVMAQARLLLNAHVMVSELTATVKALATHCEELQLRLIAFESVSPSIKPGTSAGLKASASCSAKLRAPAANSLRKESAIDDGHCHHITARSNHHDFSEHIPFFAREIKSANDAGGKRKPPALMQLCVGISPDETEFSDSARYDNDVSMLKKTIVAIYKEKHHREADLAELQATVKKAEKELLCPKCHTNRIATIVKCGHGFCWGCDPGQCLPISRCLICKVQVCNKIVITGPEHYPV